MTDQLSSPPKVPGPSPLPPLPGSVSEAPVPEIGKLPPPPLPSDTPPPPPNYEAPKAATAPQKNKFASSKIVPIFAGVLVLGLIILFVVKLLNNKPPTPQTTPVKVTTITYWGLWEPLSVMEPVISAFEKDNPSIKVKYISQSHKDYQQRLGNALSSQDPPDIVRLHSSWLPMYISNLLPAPANTVSATQIETNFYPTITSTLSLDNQVYGVPIAAEGLALFINSTMYQQASLQTPETWEDLRSNAKKLTQKDPETGKIVRAGVALGTTNNVAHWPDIVSLMLLQNGVDLFDPQPQPVIDALTFYTLFTTSDQVWDSTFPDSINAFANSKVAMILAPSWRAMEIQTINPSLSWYTAPVPQLPDTPVVSWASIWFEAVPKNAPNYEEAWQFLSYLSSAKAQQTLFESAAKDRGVPQPPANKAVASLAQQNPILEPFVTSLPTARTFYTASLTHDQATGLNSRLIKYLEDAVNAISSDRTDEVANTMILGFNQVLSQFKLVTPIPQPTQ
jgi:ABC-type glycerol-3-phosphate transport system substrate-binding protein